MHTEFLYSNPGKICRIIRDMPKLADTLMLAGDILTVKVGSPVVETIVNEFSQNWKKVFFVFGNHCFYNQNILESTKYFEELVSKFDNFTLLQTGKVVEYEGRRFLGDTFWFPDSPLHYLYKQELNDFRLIKNLEPYIYEQNTKFQEFLKNELREGDIVMTHHLPSYTIIHPNYKGDPLNRFYATECFDIIEERKPALWIHGHSHHFNDQMLANTRIVANPRGYPREVNPEFNKGLVVEV